MTNRASRIEAILTDMSTIEKIGQMTQVSNDCIEPGDIAEHGIGSVLSGGNGNPSPNTVEKWVDMVGALSDGALDSRLGVPLVYGIDAVHGHGNVRGATVFPHNIGLGAAGDAELVERIGRATATEMRATGVRWAFAPTVAVPRDIRWGRTYEGYGRDPDLVSELGAALISGLHGPDRERLDVLACAKHFVADGATGWRTVRRPEWTDWWDPWGDSWQIDQGDARITEAELDEVHLAPYRRAVDAGVMTVMASYSSINGRKNHANHTLLTDRLKHELGFGGMVVSDWMGVDQLAPDYIDSVVIAINAGIDMVMVPEDWRRFIAALAAATADGRIPMSRIDDAVRRILRVKHALGLFSGEDETPTISVIGMPAHRRLAAEAVRRSAVLLKNQGALPLSPGPIDVAGLSADDIGIQCGGWTVGWQGGSGATTTGTTLLDGLLGVRSGDVRYERLGNFGDDHRCALGLVCIGETPYAEGPGDSARPTVSDEDRLVFERMRARSDRLVLIVYSGRPLVIPELIDRADAVVAAWLPGSEGAALADVLVGSHPFLGHTPQPWPKTFEGLDHPESDPGFQVGHGLDSTPSDSGPMGVGPAQ